MDANTLLAYEKSLFEAGLASGQVLVPLAAKFPPALHGLVREALRGGPLTPAQKEAILAAEDGLLAGYLQSRRVSALEEGFLRAFAQWLLVESATGLDNGHRTESLQQVLPFLREG